MKKRMVALAAMAAILGSCGSPAETSRELSLVPVDTDRAYGHMFVDDDGDVIRGKSLDLFAGGEHLYESVSVAGNADVFFRYSEGETPEFHESLLYTDRDAAIADLRDRYYENEFRPMFAARYSEEFFADYALAVTHRFVFNTYPEEYEIDGNRITLNLCGNDHHGWFMQQNAVVLYPIPKAELNPNIDYELVQVVHPLYQ